MRQFDYTQTIPRHLIVSAPHDMTHTNIYAMFNDSLSYMVSEEALSTIDENDWSYVDGYIRWLFRVSHPYIMQDASGDPLMPSH